MTVRGANKARSAGRPQPLYSNNLDLSQSPETDYEAGGQEFESLRVRQLVCC